MKGSKRYPYLRTASLETPIVYTAKESKSEAEI